MNKLYVLFNNEKEVIGLSESYDLVIKYMAINRIAGEIREFDDIQDINKYYIDYSTLYLIGVGRDALPIRQLDQRVMNVAMEQDYYDIAYTLNTIQAVNKYDLTVKEKKTLNKTYALMQRLYNENLINRINVEFIETVLQDITTISEDICEIDNLYKIKTGRR